MFFIAFYSIPEHCRPLLCWPVFFTLIRAFTFTRSFRVVDITGTLIDITGTPIDNNGT